MASPKRKSSVPPIEFQIAPAEPHAHLFSVTLTVAKPVDQQQVCLPAWIPGSYLIREFARHLQGLVASQKGRSVAVEQLDKCTWQVQCKADVPLEIRYQVYAHDDSVRTAWLDAQRGFFNATSLCLRVLGRETSPHQLTVLRPPHVTDWQVATALAPAQIDAQGFGTYTAAHYDQLADCPVELGTFWQGRFDVAGVPHRFVVAGAPSSFDGARLLADTQRACEAVLAFWHGAAAGKTDVPFENYLFMLNAVNDGYGGLEHANSTALICTRKDLPRAHLAGQSADSKPSEGYTTLLGLICHEYFHAWCVKRLRPTGFAHYNYQSENYTQMLWFFEGFTSYYDDLLLRRAGLMDDSTYLRLLNKTINQVQQAPGRLVQNVAQASFDAWTKYYRPDANTPNATISYYSKGSLVALCFDLTLRTEGNTTLDAVMRHLWEASGAQNFGLLSPWDRVGVRARAPTLHDEDESTPGCITEADFAAALQTMGGRSFAPEIAQWIHGTTDLPLRTLLEKAGVRIHEDPAQLAQQLGLRVAETSGSVHIKTVMRGGLAEQAGFAPGDEWLGLEIGGQGWRLSRLDDVWLYAAPNTAKPARATKTPKPVTAWVSRDMRLLRLALQLPHPGTVQTTWRLGVADSARLQAWTAVQSHGK